MTDKVDHAVTAASELNAIFRRLEVPCEVCVTNEAGKHVKATANLDEGFTLVEELPIVSWPSAFLLNLRLPFCFHCLRLATHQLSPVVVDGATGNALFTSSHTSSTALGLPEQWIRCPQCTSCFCSSDCQRASARVHRLLCASLPEFRSGDHSSRAAIASGISAEALARCVAWIAQRLSSVIEQQQLTHEVLQADYNAQRNSRSSSDGSQTTWSQVSLNYQLFTQVVAPFSRLISPPDSAQLGGVSLLAWMDSVRSALAEKCVKVLLVASRAPIGKMQLHPLQFYTESQNLSTSSSQPALSSLYWAEALAHILFSTDTLRTLVGQIALNAHGINDYILPAATQSSSSSDTASPSVNIKFEWVLKGAGLYALLSSFNHSCEPNAAVSNVDDTHEIALKTTRPVQAGEEITITYIPLTASTTLAERQQLLKSYFFTCRCPRCVLEKEL